MSSYGGVTFDALIEGWSEPATAAVSVRGFPGGNNVAISLGGQREITRSVTCLFPTRGEYVNFVLLRGTVATLVIDGWDTNQAVLKEANPDPPDLGGTVRAKAQFVLV